MRLVKCNSLDLKLFQFDYDLTFAVFFLKADKTIYARYGTRSGQKGDKDVALEGLAETMRAVLELHKSNKETDGRLAAKQSPKPRFPTPEDFNSLKRFKPRLNYEGQVAKSCIHCHQIRDAQRLEFRRVNEEIPEKLLFPFPAPKILGMEFDKQTRATLVEVADKSPAAKAGLRPGDSIESLNGCTISSEADVHWLLHNLQNEKSLKIEYVRGGGRAGYGQSKPKPQKFKTVLKLAPEWRKQADISWRPTTWDLRRMATGGMVLKAADSKTREKLGIAAEKMALAVGHVGQYGNHARAKRAGIRKGDLVVSFDGQTDLMTENALIEYAMQKKRTGDSVGVEYVRNGKTRKTRLKLQ